MKVLALKAMMALCPLATHFSATNDGTQMFGRHIYVDYGELGPYSPGLQKFAILHECGHMHGNDAEKAADAWAFKHMKVSKLVVDEFCKLMNDDPKDRPRCSNLRRLYESNR